MQQNQRKRNIYEVLESLDKEEMSEKQVLECLQRIFESPYSAPSTENSSRILECMLKLLKRTKPATEPGLSNEIRCKSLAIIQNIIPNIPNTSAEIMKDTLNYIISILRGENDVNGCIIMRIINSSMVFFKLIDKSNVLDLYDISIQIYQNFQSSAHSFLMNDNYKFSNMNNSQNQSNNNQQNPNSRTGQKNFISIEHSLSIAEKLPNILLGLSEAFPDVKHKLFEELYSVISNIVSSEVEARTGDVEVYKTYLSLLFNTVTFYNRISMGIPAESKKIGPGIEMNIQLLFKCPDSATDIRRDIFHTLRRNRNEASVAIFTQHFKDILTDKLVFGEDPFYKTQIMMDGYDFQIFFLYEVYKRLSYKDLEYALYTTAVHIQQYDIMFYCKWITFRFHLAIITYMIEKYDKENEKERELNIEVIEQILLIIVEAILSFSQHLKNLNDISSSQDTYYKTVENNIRFKKLAQNKFWEEPLPDRDETGIRKVSSDRISEVGDLVISEDHYNYNCIIQLFSNMQSISMYLIKNEKILQNPKHYSYFLSKYIDFTDGFLSLIPLLCNTEQLSKEKMYIIQIFGKFLCSMPNEAFFRHILVNTFDRLYACIQDKPCLIDCVSIMMAHSKWPEILASVIIDYIYRNLELVQEENVNARDVMIKLLRFFTTFLKTKVESQSLFKPYLQRLIIKCMRLIINTKEPSIYYNILFNCLFAIQNSHFDDLQKDIVIITPDYLNELLKLQEASNDSKVTEVIIELTAHIPTPLNSVARFLHIMLYSYMLGLKGPEAVQKTCLRSLDLSIRRISHEYLFSLLQRDVYKDDFISSLYNLVYTTSYPRTNLALNILGELGGKARGELKGDLSLSRYSQPESGLPVVMTWNTSTNTKNHFILPLDLYIQLTSDILLRNILIEDPKTNDKRIYKSTRFDENALNSLRQTRCCSKEQVITFLTSCFYAFVDESVHPTTWNQSDTMNIDMNLSYVNTYDSSKMNPHSQYENKAMCRILYSLFLACNDYEIKEKAMNTVDDILQYLLYLAIHYTTLYSYTHEKDALPTSRGKLSRYDLFYIKTQFGPLPPLLPAYIYQNPFNISILCLSEAFTDIFNNNHPMYTQTANKIFDIMITIYEDITQDCYSATLYMAPLLDDIMINIFYKSNINNWKYKLHACEALYFIITRCLPIWCKRYENMILRVLFDLLRTAPPEASLDVRTISTSIIDIILYHCHHVPLPENVTLPALRYPLLNTKVAELLNNFCISQQECNKDLQELLIYQLLSKYSLLHDAAESFIHKLVVFQNENIEQWILDMGQIILSRNEVKCLQSLTFHHQLSVLYTIEFGLVLTPTKSWFNPAYKSIIMSLKSLITSCEDNFKNKSINASSLYSDFDNMNMYVPPSTTSYPFNRTTFIEIYICTIKFFIAYSKAKPDFWKDNSLSSELNTLRNKMLYLIFSTVHIVSTEIRNLCDSLLSLDYLHAYLEKLAQSKTNEYLKIIYEDLISDKVVITYSYLKSVAMFTKHMKTLPCFNSYSTSLPSACLKLLDKINKEGTKATNPDIPDIVSGLLEIISYLNTNFPTFKTILDIAFSIEKNVLVTFSSYSSIDIFYKPLAHIFNNHMQESFIYLFGDNTTSEKKLQEKHIQKAFFIILRMYNDCNSFIRYLIDHCASWRKICFSYDNKTLTMPIIGMRCIYVLAQYKVEIYDDPTTSLILERENDLIRDYYSAQNATNTNNYNVQRGYDREMYLKYINKCLLQFAKSDLPFKNANLHKILMFLLYPFAMCNISDLSEVKEFLSEYTVQHFTIQQKQSTFKFFIEIFTNHDASYDDYIRAALLKHVVIPLFSSTFVQLKKEKKSLLFFDEQLLISYITNVILPASPEGKQLPKVEYMPVLTKELLCFNTLLTKYLQEQVGKYKKVFVVYAWRILSDTHNVVSNYAYLFLSQFLVTYNINESFAGHIIQNMSKCLSPISTDVLYQAYHILIPYIYSCSSATQIDICNKFLVQICNRSISLDKQLPLWRLVLLLPDLFFHSAKTLNIYIINNMTTLMPKDLTSSSKKLYLDLVALIISYYKKEQYLRELAQKQQNTNFMTTTTTNVTVPKDTSDATYIGSSVPVLDSSINSAQEIKDVPYSNADEDHAISYSTRLFSTDISLIPSEVGDKYIRKCTIILHNLVSFLFICINSYDDTSIRRTISCIQDLFSVCSLINYSFETITKNIANKTDNRNNNTNNCIIIPLDVAQINASQLLWNLIFSKIIIAILKSGNTKPLSFFTQNLSYILNSLNLSFKHIHREYMLPLLLEYIPLIFKSTIIPVDAYNTLCSSIRDHILKGLKENRYVGIEYTTMRKVTSYNYLYMIKEIVKICPEKLPLFSEDLVTFTENLFDVYQRDLKESKNIGVNSNYPKEIIPEVDPNNKLKSIDLNFVDTPTVEETELSACLIVGLQIIGENITYLKTQRLQYFSIISKLFKFDYTVNLLLKLTTLVLHWCSLQDQVISPSEFELILLSASEIRKHSDHPHACCLFNSFAEIIRILWKKYSSHSFELTDTTIELLNDLCLFGLTVPSPTIRNQFRELFLKTLPGDVNSRLHYILEKKWTPMGSRPWFPIAIEVLLDSVNKDQTITPLRSTEYFPPFPKPKKSANQKIDEDIMQIDSAPLMTSTLSSTSINNNNNNNNNSNVNTDSNVTSIPQQTNSVVSNQDVLMDNIPTNPTTVMNTISLDMNEKSASAAVTTTTTTTNSSCSASETNAITSSVNTNMSKDIVTNMDDKLTTVPVNEQNAFVTTATTDKGLLGTTLAVHKYANISNHINSLFASRDNTYHTILSSLTELAYSDKHIQYHLWTELFPSAWSTLTHAQQLSSIPSLVCFLASDIHSNQLTVLQQTSWEQVDIELKQWSDPIVHPFAYIQEGLYGSMPTSTVVQIILEGILLCNPRPILPPSLLSYLSTDFGCGNQVAILLEQQLNQCNDELLIPTKSTLKDIYHVINENELERSLILTNPVSMYTKIGISYESYDKLNDAENAYIYAMKETRFNEYLDDKKDELALWEERWKYCSTNLGQWNSILEYSKYADDHMLSVEACSKLNRWDYVRQLLHMSDLAIENDRSNPSIMLLSTKRYITERRFDKIHDYQIAIYESILSSFRVLPIQPTAQQDIIFHYLHQAYDIKSSSQLLDITRGSDMSQEKSYIFSSLKESKPNSWDSLNIWEDIFLWRIQLFDQLAIASNSMTTSSNPSNSALLDSQHYHAMSKEYCLMLSHVAKDHGLYDAALEYFPNNIQNDAFYSKDFVDFVEEECSIYALRDKRYKECITFLDKLINSTLPGDKSNEKKNELYRMKGDYYLLAHEYDNAHGAYTTVLQSDNKNNKAWQGWGNTYYQSWLEKHESSDAVNAICSYIQATTSKHIDYWKLICRVFYLISFEHSNKKVIETFSKYQERALSYVWLPFIPFLFSHYSYKDNIYQSLLRTLIQTYPQLIRYHLIYQDPEGQPIFPTNTKSLYFNYMTNLGRLFASIVKRYYNDLDALIERISLSPHDILIEFYSSLQSTIDLIYDDTYDALIQTQNTLSESSFFDNISISEDVITYLEKMAYYFFSLSKDSLQNVSFIYKYSEAFYRDFLTFIPSASLMPTFSGNAHKPTHAMNNESFSKQITTVLDRLFTWKDMIGEQISTCTILNNHYSKYFKIQPSQSNLLEIPGQYISTLEPRSFLNNTITQVVSCNIPQSFTMKKQRYFNFYDEHNKSHYFILEQTNNHSKNEERMMYFQLYLDFYLQNNYLVQNRSIQSSYPKYIPLNVNHRLVSYSENTIGINSIMNTYMKSKNMDIRRELYRYLSDLNISLSTNNEQLTNDICFNSLCESNVFQQYILSQYLSISDYFIFRQKFTKSYAYTSFLQYMFNQQAIPLSNFTLNLQDGTVCLYHLSTISQVTKDGYGRLKNEHVLPFRLTRNFATLMGSLNINGAYKTTIGTIAMALKENEDYIREYLELLECENMFNPINQEIIPMKREENGYSQIFMNNIRNITPSVQPFECMDSKLNSLIQESQIIHDQYMLLPSIAPWF